MTLIFALERYREVIDAYMTGLERASAAGHDLSKIQSVASFFVSRVDTEIDKRLEAIGSDEALALRGKAAIANARLAYALYEEEFSGERFGALERGSQPATATVGFDRSQKPRLPRHHVRQRARGTEHREHHAGEDHDGLCRSRRGARRHGERTKAEAQQVLDDLERVGISYDDVVDVLEKEGVRSSKRPGTNWSST